MAYGSSHLVEVKGGSVTELSEGPDVIFPVLKKLQHASNLIINLQTSSPLK